MKSNITKSVAIIDYGAGNLYSVARALDYLGASPHVVTRGEELEKHSKLLFPGVGEAAAVCNSLEKAGMGSAIASFYKSGKPMLGICIGAHVFLDFSEEGNQTCLGIIPGRVERLPLGVKVPHMGWAAVKQCRQDPIMADIPDNSSFYFVHSYHPVVEKEDVVAESRHGITFCAAWRRNNMFATQFHPEKSARWGLQLLKNWLECD